MLLYFNAANGSATGDAPYVMAHSTLIPRRSPRSINPVQGFFHLPLSELLFRWPQGCQLTTQCAPTAPFLAMIEARSWHAVYWEGVFGSYQLIISRSYICGSSPYYHPPTFKSSLISSAVNSTGAALPSSQLSSGSCYCTWAGLGMRRPLAAIIGTTSRRSITRNPSNTGVYPWWVYVELNFFTCIDHSPCHPFDFIRGHSMDIGTCNKCRHLRSR